MPLWKQEGTEVIAQRNQIDFLHYENRLAALFRRRNLAQFSLLFGVTQLPPFADARRAGRELRRRAGRHRSSSTQFYEFKLGGLTFQMLHTPGETPDHLTVWIPEYKIAFPGDNYYLSFPNLYTLRGTEPRKALDYVQSLDTVLSWKPEILAPSHGNPIYGRAADPGERVASTATRSSTCTTRRCRELNAGKDVLHADAARSSCRRSSRRTRSTATSRGRCAASTRATSAGSTATSPTCTRRRRGRSIRRSSSCAGGADALAARAAELVEQGDPQRALHMADVALEARSRTTSTALQAKRQAVDAALRQPPSTSTSSAGSTPRASRSTPASRAAAVDADATRDSYTASQSRTDA